METRKRTFMTPAMAGVLRVAVAIAAVVVLSHMVDLQRAVQAMMNASAVLLVSGSLLVGANVGVRLMKWRYVLSSAGIPVTWGQAATSLFVGISLGSVTPGEVGELGGRAITLDKARAATVAGLTMLDKVQVLLVFIMAGSLALPFALLDPGLLRWLIAAVFFVVPPVLFFRLGRSGRAALAWVPFAWLKEAVGSLTLLDRRQTIRTFFYTVVFYGVLVIQFHCFLNAFEPVPFTKTASGFSSMMFAKSFLPIAAGDIGIREITSVFFFTRLGVGEPAALNAAFLMFLVNIVLPALPGLIILPLWKRTRSIANNGEVG